ECALQGARVGDVDVRLLDAQPLEHLVREAERPAVQVVTEHHVIARRQQMQDGVRRRQAAGEGETVLSTLQRGEAALERVARWIARARVLEALVLAGAGLRV